MNTQALCVKSLGIKIPWVAAFAGFAGLVVSVLKLPFVDGGQLYNIAGIMASLGGTLLGFLIASISILSAVIDRRLLVEMRKSGHYEQLLKEMFCSSIAFLSVMGVSLFCLFIGAPVLPYVLSVGVGLMVFALGLLVIAGYHFYLVMVHLK